MACQVDGDVKIRAGSEDPITLQLLDDDGTTVIDLSGATDLTLHMKNTVSGDISSITGAKLVVSDAANGKITLSQVAADFPVAANFIYFVSFTQVSKARKVPEDVNYKWVVTEGF